MKTIFTKDFIRNNLDCYLRSNRRFHPLVISELEKYSDPLTLKDLLTSKIRLQDKFWWLITKCELSEDELKELSIKVADIALTIYEKENPGDPRLRDILNSTKEGINPLIEVRDMIYELSDPNTRISGAVRSVARASKTIFTNTSKANSTAKAIYHGLVAANKNDEYLSLFNDLLKEYYGTEE